MNTKYVLIGVALVVILAGIVAFSTMTPQTPVSQTTKSSDGKIMVMATFFPMFDFARNVGGDRVEVSILVPVGVEVHDWDPAPDEIKKVASAKVLVYNGAGLEPWIGQVIKSVGSKELVAVDSSKGIKVVAGDNPQEPTDPHIWLDPVNAKQQVLNIRDALISLDPAGKAVYEKNAANYIAKLDALDAKIKDAISKATRREFVTFHEAFGYFSRRYGLEQIFIENVNAEEPNPQQLAKVLDISKQKNIKVVYAEPFKDPRLADQLAAQLQGAKVLVLDAVEEVDEAGIKAGKSYISIMEENLNNLLQGLK